jgi:uncharacterized membrane protein
MTFVSLEFFYQIGGLWLLVWAAGIARDRQHPRRWGAAAFWGLLGLLFIVGRQVPERWVGYSVAGMAVLAATGCVGGPPRRSDERASRETEAQRLGNGLFVPALLIPLTAIAGSLTLGHVGGGGWQLVKPSQLSLVSLCLGTLVALAVGMRMTRANLGEPAAEGRRLLEVAGWALLLPQMLAALGGIFAKAGVGEVVARLVGMALPTQYPFVAVLAYCLGMALFTMCLGNAFAAFAVITGGIGLPLIVQLHGGNPAIMAAIGMLSGYCGTLMTPMAANFNLVPAMLLELPDKHAVIKAQVPMALVILAANILLMWLCVYRF